jgi:hypothetical protein
MGASWTWAYFDGEGRQMAGEPLVTTAFPSQSDAESWLGESWRELAAAGVDAVTLSEDGVEVYGPMSLRASE